MRSYLSAVVGNESLRERIGIDISSGTLAQGYILAGPSGSGRHTLAYEIAMAVCCENRSQGDFPLPCGHCASCRRFQDNASPDIFWTTRADKKASIGVESVRAIRENIVFSPVAGDTKIYIIEEADLMTAEAQNALLLTLESPPPYALFLLICESPELLLETIRSRAPTLRMTRLPRDTVSSYLLEHSNDARTLQHLHPDEFEDILLTSDGCIGQALALLDDKTREPLEKQRAVTTQFLQCLSKKQIQDVLDLLRSMGNDRLTLSKQFTEFAGAIRDLILFKHTDNPTLTFFTSSDEALSYSESTPEGRLLQILKAVETASDSLLANANVRLTLHIFAMDCGLL